MTVIANRRSDQQSVIDDCNAHEWATPKFSPTVCNLYKAEQKARVNIYIYVSISHALRAAVHSAAVFTLTFAALLLCVTQCTRWCAVAHVSVRASRRSQVGCAMRKEASRALERVDLATASQ